MTTFLLIHGIPGSASTWHAVRQRLEPSHRCLAPDLLGFGGTPPTAGPDAVLAASQARHVLDVLDADRADRVVLVGHDFGGPVAAHLLAAAPGRFEALALFATNAFPDAPIPFPLSLATAPLVGGIARRLLFSRPALAMMVRRGTGNDGPLLDLDRYLGDTPQQKAIASIFGASLRRVRELYTPVEDILRSVTLPTLVGWGDHDPFFPVAAGQRTAALIQGARLRIYAGAGHFLPEERPDTVALDLIGLASTVGRR